MKAFRTALTLLALTLSTSGAQAQTVDDLFAYVSGKKWQCEADVASDLFDSGYVRMRGMVMVNLARDQPVTGMAGTGFSADGSTYSRVYEVSGYTFVNDSDGVGFVLEGFKVQRESALPYGLTWETPKFEVYSIRATGWSSEPYELHLKSVAANSQVDTTTCHLFKG
ncbi:hypothetical protein ABAC460_16565 [Asticcacaulis sp. AC460]|uniref:hypothetical protein n=1 Tax=Asticcacaulis sp. AC460 TaxID=1282360 RepID=UPI0003C3CAEC|nr:hypothetical protein [Asticcacaulis sp. AC460]ESQ88272.1 hypothetical protein ABAC460_16565 [Asticcacaulis sp. AC460]